MPRPVSIALRTRVFKRGFKKKSDADKQAVANALIQMTEDLTHPGLRAKPMTGKPDVWEAHATLGVVMTFDFIDPNTVRMRACCNHDIYRRP